jgi:hypothetical protein
MSAIVITNSLFINLTQSYFNFFLIKCDVSSMTVLAFSGLNEQHRSLSIGGIPLLILATQESRCVGKNSGISPVIKMVFTHGSR